MQTARPSPVSWSAGAGALEPDGLVLRRIQCQQPLSATTAAELRAATARPVLRDGLPPPAEDHCSPAASQDQSPPPAQAPPPASSRGCCRLSADARHASRRRKVAAETGLSLRSSVTGPVRPVAPIVDREPDTPDMTDPYAAAPYEAAAASAARLAQATGKPRHDIAVVLGSGWAAAADAIGAADARGRVRRPRRLPGADGARPPRRPSARSASPAATRWSSSAAPTCMKATPPRPSCTACGPRSRRAARPSCSPTRRAASRPGCGLVSRC